MANTTANTHEITISARSHQYGLGWTNSATQVRGTLAVAPVTGPQVVGTKRQISRALESAVRGNSGNDWRFNLYVNGQRVAPAPWQDRVTVNVIRDILSQRGDITVDVYGEE